MSSHAPDAPSVCRLDVPSRVTKLHRQIRTTVPLAREKKEKKKKLLWVKSPRENPQHEMWETNVLLNAFCSGHWYPCFCFTVVHSARSPRSQLSQLLLQSQLTVLPLTQIPTRDRGAGIANPHRTAAPLKLFVFMDRDTEPRLWIVKSLLECRMLH